MTTNSIVAMDDEISIEVVATNGFSRIGNKGSIRNRQMMIINKLFSFEIQFGHLFSFYRRLTSLVETAAIV